MILEVVMLPPPYFQISKTAEPGSPFNKVAGLGFDGVPEDGALDELERQFDERECPIQVELASLAVGERDGHPAVRGRDDREADLETDGCRQHEAKVVVGVLADQVDPAGRPDHADRGRIGRDARFVAAQPLGERLDLERAKAHGSASSFAGSCGCRSRSVAAVSSGSVSLMNAPAPASEPARYLSLVAVRFGG